MSAQGMTLAEEDALKKSAALWDAMVSLDDKHPDDDLEVRLAIHRIQAIVGARIARRVNPEIWWQGDLTDSH